MMRAISNVHEGRIRPVGRRLPIPALNVPLRIGKPYFIKLVEKFEGYHLGSFFLATPFLPVC